MSIHTDFRQVSDDIWEYSEWLNEVKREYRKEQHEQDHVDDFNDSEGDIDDERT